MIGHKPGEKIAEDGVYPSVPLDDYHGDLCAGHSASHSSLDLIFTKSPLHYWDRCYANPHRAPDAPTEQMILGRAGHHLFLGERQFQKFYIRRPAMAPDGRNWHERNGSCVAWNEKFVNRKKLIPITPNQLEALAGMMTSLQREPMIINGLLGGRIEQSFVWRDRETGIWLKARPDAVPTDGDFADLKIVSDISDEGIQSTIARFGYHRQGALILEGAHRLLNLPLQFRGPGEGDGMSFTLVFVESKRPHAIEIITLRPADLERGMDENRAALRLLKRSLDSDEWPGPSGHQKDGRYLGLTQWASDRNQYRVDQINALLAIEKPEIRTDAG